MKYRDLLEKIQKALLDNSSEVHSHSYASVPRVPQNLPIQAKPVKKALRQTDIVTKEWNDEVKHTSAYSSNIEFEPRSKMNLAPARVNRWNLKNYSSLARRLQKLAKSKPEDMSGKVSVISQQEKTAKEEKKQDQLWRDMMKVNEERQFRIGRITDFFS